MALVGDIIVDARAQGVPDPPQVLSAPGASSVTFSLTTGTPVLPAAELFLVATYTNQWGETKSGPEVNLTPDGSTQVIQVSGTLGWATGVRVYIGTSSGVYNAYVPFASLPGTISGGTVAGMPTNSVPGQPPVRSSAWLPDTDGSFAPAFLVYRWLNDGLLESAKASGGIPDMVGAPTVLGQNVYTLPGSWLTFSDFWYDGYQIQGGTRADNWYQSSIQSLSWNVVTDQWANQSRMEIFPQAQRTSGRGTLSSSMLSTDVTANVTFDANDPFVVPVGLILVGTLGGADGTFEIMTYTNFSATQITSLGRGFGGTNPQAWPQGTNVYELNVRLSGKRYAQTRVPGDSTKTIDIPNEWVEPMKDYVTAQFKKAEHDMASAKELLSSFYSVMRAYGQMNGKRTGPKQMGADQGLLVYYPTPFHAVILP